jgi:hypothetical protein
MEDRLLITSRSVHTPKNKQTPPHHILLSISIRKSTSSLRYIRPCSDLQISPHYFPLKVSLFADSFFIFFSLVLQFDSPQCNMVFSYLVRPDWLWLCISPRLLLYGYRDSVPLGKAAGGGGEFDHPPSISKLRMGGTIRLLQIYAPWRAYRWNVNFTLSPPLLSRFAFYFDIFLTAASPGHRRIKTGILKRQ